MTKRRGQTLVELLVAMFVISIGLFAAVGLVYSNLALVDRDTDEVIVVNLAREGVELAKETRDANWLAGDKFDQGLHNSADFSAAPVWDGTVTVPTFDFAPDLITQAKSQVIMMGSTSTAPGFYANDNAAAGISGNATPFHRLLIFHPICNDYSVQPDGTGCPSLGLTKIGIRVESHVQWTRKNILKDYTIYSDLYDWR